MQNISHKIITQISKLQNPKKLVSIQKYNCTYESGPLNQHEQKFGKIPSENLFSKTLKNQYENEVKQKYLDQQQKLKDLQQEIDIEINQNNQSIVNTQKEENFLIPAQQYIHFRKYNPYGNANIIDYKGSQFTLIGTQYQFLPIKNIYKMLKFSKPEIICLQIRPDQILKQFIINIKNNSDENGYFSSSKYFRQILKKGYEIMPSNFHRKKVEQDLLQNRIFLTQMSNKDEQYYEEYSKELKKNYKPYTHQERLSMDTIATACFYAERNNLPIVLCDLPEIVFRQDVANRHTLMQLQNILTKCSRAIALEPDLVPHTPLSIAYNLMPEEFLGKSDQYISTIFQYLQAKKYKKITALLGCNQSDSIQTILENRKTNHLADHLEPYKVKHSLVRDITAEEILEKHSILDVLMNGKDIMEDFENLQFQTTYEIINRYGNPDFTDRSRLDNLRVMHYKFLQKYSKFAQLEYQEGQVLLRQEYLKKIGYQ